MARIRSIKPEFWRRQCEAWDGGYTLYLLQEEQVGPVKIGVATHPARRWSALQGGNPRKVALVAIFEGERDDCWEIEKATLAHFADRKLCGEWIAAPLDTVLKFLGGYAQ